MMSSVVVQTLSVHWLLPWGEVAYLKVYATDYRRLNWLEVWQAFRDIYPERWAIELFPPETELVNDAHVYHLWLMPGDWLPPSEMNLAEKYRA